MGCFASKPAVPLSSPTSTAPALRSEGPSHEANRHASQAPVALSSRPNAATQAPLPSGHPDRAVHDTRLTAQLPSQPPPPFAADVPPPPHKETTVSSSSLDAAGTSTSLPVQPNKEVHNVRPYEQNRTRPAPSSYHSVPINRPKYAQPLSSSTSTAAAPRSEGPSHAANRHASQAASSSRPNAATQAPFSPSGHAPDRAVHDTGQTAQLPSQAPPPFAADVPPPPHKGNTTPAPKSPQRGGLAPSSTHKEETLVSSSSLGAAGMTTSLPAQPNTEVHDFRPYEHNRTRPAPSPYHSVPIKRSKSAQPLSQSGLPPQAVLASSPLHNDGMPMSLPSQRGGEMAASPPAQPNVETYQSRPHEYDRQTRAPSSYRSAPPVNRSMSAQLLSQSGSGAPSSHSMARTMSASEFSSDTKSKDIPRKHPRSTPGTNRVHGAEDNKHRRFPSTVRTVLSDNLRFRILVVGKRSSGKSSLINSTFKVDMSAALGNMSRTLKTGDINTGYAAGENRHLIVHEYSSFEPGVQNMSTVREFVIDRTRANRPASERLHTIWICVPTSDIIDGNLGDRVDEILGLSRVVPVVIVATKFDLVVSQALFDIARGDNRYYEQARTAAHERYDQSCRSLFPRNTRVVPVEAVSTKTRFGDLISKLITTTHKLITSDPNNAIMPPAYSQIAPVPFVWSIAQRVSHDLIIRASIEVGSSRYWRSLGSSQDFTDQIFEDCVEVIHTDIVNVWSLRGEHGYLLGREFKTKMYDLVKDLAESHVGSLLSSKPTSRSGAGWASTSYQNSVEHVRCMMGYIVDLTVILHWLFVSARDVSTNKVHEAMDYHVNSGLQKDIHQDISRFVTMEVLSMYRGNDLLMEKIIDLIRQYCVPRQST